MPNKAYNYNFKMFMEGLEVPFKSIQIMCTPNGVEASINLLSNRQVFDLKPKTAVQVFYRDWTPTRGKHGWRLMFDGFLSSYVKSDQALQGRALSIVCRDFRMDIRKAPASLVFQADSQDIGIETLYHAQGIYRRSVVKGGRSVPTRVFETTGLQPLSAMIARIAGTAYGKRRVATKNNNKRKSNQKLDKPAVDIPEGVGTVVSQTETVNVDYKDSLRFDDEIQELKVQDKIEEEKEKQQEQQKQKNGESIYAKKIGDSIAKDSESKADCRMFLDAVVRGLWTEAVGGTSIAEFINKRIRVDKRFLIPANKTGYNFWSRQGAGLNAGSVLLGNSRFTSIEAAIMRLAGLFSVRVYSCNTPSLISLEGEALKWIMDDKVKKYLVDDHKKEFGAKYILNETMLLPPLEFSSPPNCNLFFPPMYERVNWQYDIDGDVTRGYFKVIDTISTKGSSGLKGKSAQFPNALFDAYTYKKDKWGRTKSPITEEERYKGVSVRYGSVQDLLARKDACREFPESTYAKEIADKIRQKEAELKTKISDLDKKSVIKKQVLEKRLSTLKAQRVKVQADAKKKLKAKGGGYSNTNASVALDRHAALKFLNAKFSGRVAVVDMAFNPYPMAGFPGAIIVDDESYGGESSKTIIGMVQQVKHTISIAPGGGDASTSIVLNNARFEDEPTDVDKHGNPLYMKETNADAAEIDVDVNAYANAYFTPDPEPLKVRDLNDKYYDLDENKKAEGYIYAKDIITLSKNDIKKAENNALYLDNEYMPNRIHKFYKEVFNHTEDHFMIGQTQSTKDPRRTIKFAYDTMHEAFDRLRSDKKYLLNNYEECLKFVSRDICSADAFFQGIIGSSIKTTRVENNGETVTEYIVNQDDYDPERIKTEYFGITTKDWNSRSEVKGLKEENNGLMTDAGQFSSIKEHMPLTAFIKERRDAVEEYLSKVKERVEGVSFANIQRYPESK